jgi:hypothetical protein
MLSGPCPKYGCFKIVEDLELVPGSLYKGMHESVRTEETKGGVIGEFVEKGRE